MAKCECGNEAHKEGSYICAECLQKKLDIEIGIAESKWF